jgi:hypothetical protein
MHLSIGHKIVGFNIPQAGTAVKRTPKCFSMRPALNVVQGGMRIEEENRKNPKSVIHNPQSGIDPLLAGKR